LAVEMPPPVHFAAMDAGSNAIRLVIARAGSLQDMEELHAERAAVRLGHHVFTNGRMDEDTITRAVRAFRLFRNLMDRYGVTAWRAVGTAATREARNSRRLIARIREKAGIDLQVISSAEEARLVRLAVRGALGDTVTPQLIFDLGGGSLELNFLDARKIVRSTALPLGTVRLMDTCHVEGKISKDTYTQLRQKVRALLRTSATHLRKTGDGPAVACGGNAEALATIVPGPRFRGLPVLNAAALREQLWDILERDVPGRMREYGVRRDRAEVMGIAAIVIYTITEWLGVRELVVPGVGVREGVLLELVAQHFGPVQLSETERKQQRILLAGAEWFARRTGYDSRHAAEVCRLAGSLFDQLRPLHRMRAEMRALLEVAAILHDTGNFISRKSHHRHGEYLVRYSEIPGLQGLQRDIVACMVRYHNGKSDPRPDHKMYHSLDNEQRREIRMLSAILRIAEKLDDGHHAGVASVQVAIERRNVIFRIQPRPGTILNLLGLQRRAALFESEFDHKAIFRRTQLKEQVA
jgi:exopolyphosphatase/guanosine-5'-triphosphate,3'-diphosphate pyrophosphatase